ncbi:unnamed protein product [Enterobius vermicularis]|uniref:BACK domain-containing protein n=1 Tax=Enterobius vermicularis TaxID=51028 RepID=A0A0N4UX53_ENTVE|nr:unnamed protein product [Enterobius vermicularis]
MYYGIYPAAILNAVQRLLSSVIVEDFLDIHCIWLSSFNACIMSRKYMNNPDGIDQLSDLGKQLFYNGPASTSYFDVRDCSVITVDGKRFKISKQILDFYPTFAKLICRCDELGGSQEKFIMSSTLDYELIKDLFNCLINDKLESNTYEKLSKILQQACEWDLEKVKRKVIDKMTSNTRVEDSINVYKTCLAFSPNLEKQTFEYLTYTLPAAVLEGKDVGFRELPLNDVKEILSADLLNVESELDVWKMAKAWLLHEKKSRLSSAPELLSCIRQSLLTVSEVIDFFYITTDPYSGKQTRFVDGYLAGHLRARYENVKDD